MSSSSSVSIGHAVAITCLSIVTANVVFIRTIERLFVIKRQQDDSFFVTARSLMWQHSAVFYNLWLLRCIVGIIACILPLAPMWVELVLEQHNVSHGVAIVWATSALMACIAGGIAGERLLYLGFTDSLNGEQLACTVLSILAIFLLIISELVNLVPLPIVWAVTGVALHRLSMVIWWYIVSSKRHVSHQFRDRARLTLAGHGLAFACVFVTFLPVFETDLERLFWLFAVSFAVELVTTAQGVRVTYSYWFVERADARRRIQDMYADSPPMPRITITITHSPASLSQPPLQQASSVPDPSPDTFGQDVGDIPLTEMTPGTGHNVDSDQISFGTMLKELEENGTAGSKEPAAAPTKAE